MVVFKTWPSSYLFVISLLNCFLNLFAMHHIVFLVIHVAFFFCNLDIIVWLLNIPKGPYVRLGCQPMALLGGGGTFRRWDLLKES
jgi:hypothetical protein